MNHGRSESVMHTALLPAVIACMLVLGACSSDDDDDSTVAGTNVDGAAPAGATVDDGAADDNVDADSFDTTFTEFDCVEVTSTEAVAELSLDDPALTCGRVTVPANWEVPDGDTIDLAVYRVAPTSASPAPDPLVILAGGPGQPGVSLLNDFIEGGATALRERSEVVVIDQRGTGFSIPSLTCPAIAAFEQGDPGDVALDTPDAQIAAQQEAVIACVDEFMGQNVNLADYTTANNARDIDAVRDALGVEQWNLYGGSYGTTLALTIMRDWPGGVRSAVLDSVAPLQASLLAEEAYRGGYWPLSRIVDNCEADADCGEFVGDIRIPLEVGIARLANAPIGGLTADVYIATVLAESIGDPFLPTIITLIAEGSDEEVIAGLTQGEQGDEKTEPSLDESAPLPVADTPPGLIPLLDADILYAAIVCAEEIPYSDSTVSPDLSADFQETTREVIETGAAQTAYDTDFCNLLGIPAADAIESEAVQSDLPTLVLAGDTDVQTPPAWSRSAADTLSGSQYVEFPRAGHVVVADGFDCSMELLVAFLDNPEAEVDRSCVEALPPVDYIVEPDAGIAAGTLAMPESIPGR